MCINNYIYVCMYILKHINIIIYTHIYLINCISAYIHRFSINTNYFIHNLSNTFLYTTLSVI